MASYGPRIDWGCPRVQAVLLFMGNKRAAAYGVEGQIGLEGAGVQTGLQPEEGWTRP